MLAFEVDYEARNCRRARSDVSSLALGECHAICVDALVERPRLLLLGRRDPGALDVRAICRIDSRVACINVRFAIVSGQARKALKAYQSRSKPSSSF
jgi:hypothetical protein